MSAEWQPSSIDRQLAQEAYVHYVGGTAILNQPGSDFSRGIHQRELTAGGLEPIIVHAENLMYEGLRRLIAHANQPDLRSDLQQAEHNFEAAFPHMRAAVEAAYDEQADRLERLNAALFSLRPAPMYDRVVYGFVCHARLGKLRTERLMGGLQVAPEFGSQLVGRTLGHALSGYRGNRENL